jgi:hypothetical protein
MSSQLTDPPWLSDDLLPLGRARSASRVALSPISRAMWVGAENLLIKALRNLSQGDDANAVRLVERACRLPYDAHEDAHPAGLAAHMILFEIITDEMEEADEHDSRWLGAALSLLHEIGEDERIELGHVLQAIRQDYSLERREAMRLDAALRDMPETPELRDRGDLGPEILTPVVLGILQTVLAYNNAVRAST